MIVAEFSGYFWRARARRKALRRRNLLAFLKIIRDGGTIVMHPSARILFERGEPRMHEWAANPVIFNPYIKPGQVFAVEKKDWSITPSFNFSPREAK